ncbi:hypothetical protein BDZ89DRAFT_1071022 [Hymenopellis radicata]|nr:hypothetical protein BDZ89DRAFT_1071022 [Hymenopellis radicata]
MPFSLENTWTACEGATKCPCPNHLPPTLRLQSVFRDPIDDDPLLYHLAIGNDCPTPTQENVLASSLSDTKSNIENVDRSLEKIIQLRHALLAEIGTVERELQLLRDHGAQLSRAVQRREQILAPIRRMPSEILAHILRFTLEKPALRSSRWFGRPRLSDNAQSWHAMGIGCDRGRAGRISARLPLVEARHSQLSRALISDDNSIALFANLPNLIVYRTVDITDPLGWYQIPWLQLKRFSVKFGPSPPDFESQSAFSVLQRATHLERIMLDLSAGSLSLQIENDPILCAHLTTLKLNLDHRRGENPILQIFTHCTFPKLTDLDVVFPDPGEPAVFHALVVCLQRSRSPLSALGYHGGDIVSTDMIALLKTTPTLTTVFMEEYVSGIDDAVLRCLCVPQDPDAVVCVPGFRSLHIDGDIQFNPSLFVDMVKSRWDVAPLHSIGLYLWDTTKETRAKAQSIVRGLKPYEALGLKLDYSGGLL